MGVVKNVVLTIMAATALAFIVAGQVTNSVFVSDKTDISTSVCKDGFFYISLGLWKYCTGCSTPFPESDKGVSGVGTCSDNCDITDSTQCTKFKVGRAFAIIGSVAILGAAVVSFMGTDEMKMVKMGVFALAAISGVILCAVTSNGSLDIGDNINIGPTYGFNIIFTILSGIGAGLSFF